MYSQSTLRLGLLFTTNSRPLLFAFSPVQLSMTLVHFPFYIVRLLLPQKTHGIVKELLIQLTTPVCTRCSKRHLIYKEKSCKADRATGCSGDRMVGTC